MTHKGRASGFHQVHSALLRSSSEPVEAFLRERQELYALALAHLRHIAPLLASVADLLLDTLRTGHKLLSAGNGGSAAEAQHFAAELVGRFQQDRVPYAAIALSTDSSILTAVANDYGYDHIFARQIFALGQPGDLLLVFSTSGESENLVRASVAARQRSMHVVAVTGEQKSRLSRLADFCIPVPASDTAVIQELHTVITHLLCTIVESTLCAEDSLP